MSTNYAGNYCGGYLGSFLGYVSGTAIPSVPTGTNIRYLGSYVGEYVGDYLGAATVVSDVAQTLAQAIIERFDATSTLVSLVPGGLHYRIAPESARDNPPYGEISEITEVINENTSGPSWFEESWQLSIFVEQGYELDMSRIRNAWYATFGPKKPPLVWQGRRMIYFSNSNSRVMDDDGDAAGGSSGETIQLNQLIIEFSVLSQPSSTG